MTEAQKEAKREYDRLYMRARRQLAEVREREKHYQQSANGREQSAKRQKRYRESEKGQSYYARWRRSEEARRTAARSRKKYRASERGRKAIRAADRRRYRIAPKKKRARALAYHALKIGKLIARGCEVCGIPAQAHHDDYAEPLKVRWLCFEHHLEEHGKRPVAG